ncbi:SURF1 family protein [Qipengyuania sp. JC766]|uniref:SURF1 family protein n=1 Tax=Qipengyuania sp. JC766 TaxID=3232139 RepID=UPI00345751DD
MKLKDFPPFASIVVLLAVGVMIGLGIWQLGRHQEKTALIAEYAAVDQDRPPVIFETIADNTEAKLYRPVSGICQTVRSIESGAGTAANGAKGWAHTANCVVGDGLEVPVVLGWTLEPETPSWDGGEFEGILAPGPRIVAEPALAGLGQLARPDPSDLPNNHLAYAGQWFFFALVALVIFALAVRGRAKKRDG